MEIKSETFDTTKYRLGKLCSRNHEYENTGMSLRYKNKKSPICLKCKCEASKRNRLKKKSGLLPLEPITHYDPLNNDVIICPKCNSLDLNRRKNIDFRNGTKGILLFCSSCKRKISWHFGEPRGRRPSAQKQVKPISPTGITKPRTPVANYRNPIQAKAEVIKLLQRGEATAEQIAKKLKESDRYIEAILYELVTEDYSPITFDRTTKIYKYLMFEPNKK